MALAVTVGPRVEVFRDGEMWPAERIALEQSWAFDPDQMCDESAVTVQIHWLRIDRNQEPVPALAVHIPTALRKDDVIAQDA